MSRAIKQSYRFGEFTVDADQKVLLFRDKPRPLTPKVFDTLLILVENSGRIVNKEELMSRLWPDTFVEEANLTSNILQLRKSLGDNARHPTYIETVARRGYRFIKPVETDGLSRSVVAADTAADLDSISITAADYPIRVVRARESAGAETPCSSGVIKVAGRTWVVVVVIAALGGWYRVVSPLIAAAATELRE